MNGGNASASEAELLFKHVRHSSGRSRCKVGAMFKIAVIDNFEIAKAEVRL